MFKYVIHCVLLNTNKTFKKLITGCFLRKYCRSNQHSSWPYSYISRNFCSNPNDRRDTGSTIWTLNVRLAVWFAAWMRFVLAASWMATNHRHADCVPCSHYRTISEVKTTRNSWNKIAFLTLLDIRKLRAKLLCAQGETTRNVTRYYSAAHKYGTFTIIVLVTHTNNTIETDTRQIGCRIAKSYVGIQKI